MLKRAFDISIAIILLVIFLPLLAIISLAIFLTDFHSPLYIAERVGKNGRPFRMVKLRSMVVGGDRNGVTSTSASDTRITPVGRYVRAFKLDEVTQLWNVLNGDMSLVGPRPNVPGGVEVYTNAERRLLSVRPGLTDFASIVFADEGKVLEAYPDPDEAYDRLIRPWKSRLALFYLEKSGFLLDFRIIFWTGAAILSRHTALKGIADLLESLDAPSSLVRLSRRLEPLQPAEPPGSGEVAAAP